MTAGEVLLDFHATQQPVELAVDEGVKLVRVEMVYGLVHADSPNCGCRSWRSAARAREIRDMTVPMGKSRMTCDVSVFESFDIAEQESLAQLAVEAGRERCRERPGY